MLDVNILKEQLENLLKDDGYTIEDIKYHKIEGENVLSIVVDHEENIDLAKISMVSEKISNFLDEIDPIEDAYTLDVSSLGAEKPIRLDRLEHYVDKKINVHLIHPYLGENYLEGILKEVSDDEAIIAYKEKTRTKEAKILRKNIDRARLAV